MDLIIANGQIVNGHKVTVGNILVKGGKIAGVVDNAENIQADRVIDARGKLVFPGGIDPHVHFNDPGFTWREDFSCGTKAAAAGGITTIVDMPLQNTPPLKDGKAFDDKAAEVGPKAYVDYGFWGAFINDNTGSFREMADKGCCSLKAFMSSAGEDYPYVHNGLIRQAMLQAKELDVTLGFHCEDYHIIETEENKRISENKNTRQDFLDSRPLIAELIATKNIIDLAAETGAKVHICHVSHPDVAEEIRSAKAAGVLITAETCTHYLVFTKDDMVKKGTLLKCAPPLRDEGARDRLWQYVLDGTLDCVVSDHSPGTWEEKSDDDGKKPVWQVWSGISGAQTSFQILFDQAVHKRKLCPSLLARVLSKNAAGIFGLPGKGEIILGNDADFAIVDPELEWEITDASLFYKNKFSGFTGLLGKGAVVQTIVRGQDVYKEGSITGEPGYGKLIRKG